MIHASSAILITGATSQIGEFLCHRAQARGAPLLLASRTPPSTTPLGASWHAIDIAQGGKLPPAPALIHLAPLHLLPPLLPHFVAQGGKRVIAFSTTSRFSKARSHYAAEQAYAARLMAAEEEVARCCQQHDVAWTLFRPTLIYGAGRDRNVAFISRFVRRFGFFPLLGEAKGLRQPVHADDLAAACLAALDNPATFNKAYDLPGGETLAYREMVERIFIAHGRRARFIPLPVALFGLFMRLLSCLPRYRDFNPEMARRMNQDLVFDHTPAQRDFGFDPRPFDPLGKHAEQ